MYTQAAIIVRPVATDKYRILLLRNLLLFSIQILLGWENHWALDALLKGGIFFPSLL